MPRVGRNPARPRPPLAAGGVIYLDHQATTPLDRRVLAAMRPWLESGSVGNPHATTHRLGWQAGEAVERARGEIAGLIGGDAGGVVLTSGATEANNLALFGASRPRGFVAMSAVEHPSVLDCRDELVRRDRRVHTIPVDTHGIVALDRLETLLAGRRGPALVSVMTANNETGAIQPVREVARLCRDYGALFHTDAVQALTALAFDVAEVGADLVSLSGHKIYGPPGIGALWVRDGVEVAPILFGGGQQGGRRPGTVPTVLAVGLGAACSIAAAERNADAARLTQLREHLFAALYAQRPTLQRNGRKETTLPGCLNVTLPGVEAAELLLAIPDLALATGSACSSGREEPSHVLLAMGRSYEDAAGSIRFGLGRQTTESDIETAVRLLAEALAAHSA